MTGHALLRAEKVSAGYGSGPVIREIDVEVRQGELVALLGANGAGKTTALLAIAGAVPISAGRMLWEGSLLDEPLHKRARRGLALITDDRALFMRLSVMDNLLVGRCDVERAFALFPELLAAGRPENRTAVRRRAADADAGSRARASAKALAVRRVVARSGPARHSAALRGPARGRRERRRGSRRGTTCHADFAGGNPRVRNEPRAHRPVRDRTGDQGALE